MDPLDGTTNFTHGYPSFAVSVAVLRHTTPVASTGKRRVSPQPPKQPCCNCRQLLSGSNGSFVARLLASDGAAWCCCAVIEFTGGPGSWITRTYAAARNAGATCNGKPIQVR